MAGKLAGVCIATVLLSQTVLASNLLETVGDIGQVALPVAAISMAIYHHDRQGLYEFAYTGITTIATVQILKHVVQRRRPNGHDMSFPSGHTAAAFAGAGFLQMRYGRYYGVPAYMLATLTGYSRIQSRYHWTSDVLVGAAIGLGTNLIFTHRYNNIKVEPYMNGSDQERGVMLTAGL